MSEEVVQEQEQVKKPIPPAPIPTVEERFGRSEEEIMTDAPLVLRFGNQEHHVKPLVIQDSKEWRKKYLAFIRVAREKRDPDKALEFGGLEILDHYVTLICAYSKGEISRALIESTATEAELVQAWEALEDFVCRPFLRLMP